MQGGIAVLVMKIRFGASFEKISDGIFAFAPDVAHQYRRTIHALGIHIKLRLGEQRVRDLVVLVLDRAQDSCVAEIVFRVDIGAALYQRVDDFWIAMRSSRN